MKGLRVSLQQLIDFTLQLCMFCMFFFFFLACFVSSSCRLAGNTVSLMLPLDQWHASRIGGS